MVKFSKQFEGQLVPEWKHAFVDYCLLKKDLKRVQHARLLLGRHHAAADRCEAGLADTQQTAASHHAERASLSLSQWLLDRLPAGHLFGFSNAPNKDHGVIHVHRRKLAGSSASRGGGGGDDDYETELMEPVGVDADAGAAREFFARLDAQLNKVNQFYKGKEQEFLERGRSLRRQMDILADLRAATAKARDDPSAASASANAANRGDELS